MSGRMDGKKVVVVGAGQLPSELIGNGRAIAALMAREGAEVCAVDMVESRVKETVEQITSEGGRAHQVVADVHRPADCARIIDEARSAMGRIDVLVNNVGVNRGDTNPLKLDEETWQRIFDINLRAMWLTSRAVVPLMQEQRGGVITNISSIGSRTAGGPLFAYGISKAGVNALTHYFAVTYAPWGIRCNSVLPAWVVTPHSMDGLKNAGLAVTEQQYYEYSRRSVPLGRLGTAADVANAVLFLSSDEGNFITGVELPVDGGALAVIGSYQRPADAPA